MNHWNTQFTQMIRKTRPSYWGNWALSGEIAPGAVGVVDPMTGEFTLVADRLEGLTDASLATSRVSSDWSMMTSNVSRTETKIDLDGSAVDPETGTRIEAGVNVEWKFSTQGEMVSQCALASQVMLRDADRTLDAGFDWLAARARESGMGDGSRIAQGFGVVTGVQYARSGLNVASLSADNTFSLAGSVSGVNAMLGKAEGKGSFVSARSSRSVDSHLWPSESGQVAGDPVPIAYTFASFDGRLLLPRWITHIGAYQLILRNNHGGTYIVSAELQYDTPRGAVRRTATISGGLTASISDIPLDATGIRLRLGFKGMFSTEEKTFHWANPRGQWISGVRHVDLFGVWPGETRAVDVEAGLPLA
ncbi:hypothetical protein QFW77_15100 [Luteimonas sp. RD2P54]|uniref:DUF1983 domain-containing protein n=1 Tax=Luteimonas endophytica TaxID=3042023 RepID=A0ABT6JDM5_9GAMM|nr:hypothetical protein [Luteimonas endophytica]MDH5824303.1 hypothetical protein [Luteimonas endophytica]